MAERRDWPHPPPFLGSTDALIDFADHPAVAMIQEQVKVGLERARAQGKQLGRPTVSAEVEARITELRGEGMGKIKIKIAKTLGIGVSAVQRVVG